uniref:LAS1 like ribosome biosis factor n=1 Tax=Latimeria chalumnae TaxID=7897 RepID=H3B4A8_LATCH
MSLCHCGILFVSLPPPKVLEELKAVAKARQAWSSPSSEVEWIIAQVKELAQENREFVAEVFLDDGFLIPTVEQLQALNISYAEDFECDVSTWLRIPQTFLRFWQPLVQNMHSKDFTQTLLEKLFAKLKEHCDSPGTRARFVVGWIAEILTANYKARKPRRSRSRMLGRAKNKWRFFVSRVPLQWKKLMDSCLATPCRASPAILQLIFQDMQPQLPADTQHNLLQLCSIYTRGAAPLPPPGSGRAPAHGEERVYTVESLRRKIQQEVPCKVRAHRAEEVAPVPDSEEEEEEEEEGDPMDVQMVSGHYRQKVNPEVIAEKVTALEGSAWQLCTDEINWRDYPLGKVPGQLEDPNCFLLDNYSVMSVLDQPIAEDRTSLHNTTGSSVSEGLLWTQGELHHLKAGLQLF